MSNCTTKYWCDIAKQLWVLGLVTFYSIWQVCSMAEMHCFLVQSSDPEGKPGFSGRLLQLSEQNGYCLILFFELCIGYKLLTPVFQEHSGGPGGCLLKDFQWLHRIPVLISNSWQGYCKDRGHAILIRITFLSLSRRYFKYLQNFLSVFLESWRGEVY